MGADNQIQINIGDYNNLVFQFEIYSNLCSFLANNAFIHDLLINLSMVRWSNAYKTFVGALFARKEKQEQRFEEISN